MGRDELSGKISDAERLLQILRAAEERTAILADVMRGLPNAGQMDEQLEHAASSARTLWRVLDNVSDTRRLSDDLGTALDRANSLRGVLEGLPDIDGLVTQLARACELAERLGKIPRDL
jgi:hypothetical protein